MHLAGRSDHPLTCLKDDEKLAMAFGKGNWKRDQAGCPKVAKTLASFAPHTVPDAGAENAFSDVSGTESSPASGESPAGLRCRWKRPCRCP